jgi:hypothetical protein
MKLILETPNLQDYLIEDEHVDFDHSQIREMRW